MRPTIVFVLLICVGLAAEAAERPVAVSPGALIEGRCPTFSWGEVEGAKSYELVVYRFGEDSSGVKPVLQQSFAGSVGSWTPSLEQCLKAGGRYAWVVRAQGHKKASEWSDPSLFSIAEGPSAAEVEAALGVLRRYRRYEQPEARRESGARESIARAEAGAEGNKVRPDRGKLRQRLGGAEKVLGDVEGVVAATAPLPSAAPSLTVDDQIHLGASSAIFKDGSLFLWSDGINTGLGRDALVSNTTGNDNTAAGTFALYFNTTGSFNTAAGVSALILNTTGGENTASGVFALEQNNTGNSNTAVGFAALRENTTGFRNTASGSGALGFNDTGVNNTASGYAALRYNTAGSNNTASGRTALLRTTGSANTAVGFDALESNTTGSHNTAIGYKAGVNATTGSNNIFIGRGADGVAGEASTIRIGGGAFQNRAFVEGIRGVTTGVADATNVMIDSAGQLGTISSSRRYKEAIEEMGALSDRLLALRPVTFRYKEEFADGTKPIQFGLIAEEVAEVFPELVVYDEEGRPQTVKYHLLSTLLLNELQKQSQKLAKLEHLEVRLARLEAIEKRPPQLASIDARSSP